MKTALWFFLLTCPITAQIEATDPGTGLLMTAKIRYAGQLLEPGVPRADALRILGQVRTTEKLRQISSIKLAADLRRATTILYELNESAIMRNKRRGLARPVTDERANFIGPSFEKLIVAACGVCWLEVVEKQLGKREALRVVFLGPTRDQLAVAAVILDKTRNQVAAELEKPWTGTRLLLLGDRAVRLTQSAGQFTDEDIDLDTGKAK